MLIRNFQNGEFEKYHECNIFLVMDLLFQNSKCLERIPNSEIIVTFLTNPN